MDDKKSSISNFDEMVKQFKDMNELQAYCNAQYKTITELNRQITVLKAEKSSAEKILATIPTMGANIIEFPKFSISPEEEICLQQLHLINQTSKNSVLTLEDARKTEIYSKILLNLKAQPKDIDGAAKNLSTDELLKLAGSPDLIK